MKRQARSELLRPPTQLTTFTPTTCHPTTDTFMSSLMKSPPTWLVLRTTFVNHTHRDTAEAAISANGGTLVPPSPPSPNLLLCDAIISTKNRLIIDMFKRSLQTNLVALSPTLPCHRVVMPALPTQLFCENGPLSSCRSESEITSQYLKENGGCRWERRRKGGWAGCSYSAGQCQCGRLVLTACRGSGGAREQEKERDEREGREEREAVL
jgi:hypothetical protein